MAIPHWVSTRNRLLGILGIGHKKYLEILRVVPNYHAIQETVTPPLFQKLQNESHLFHTIASFEASGCRVISPTPALVEALKRTDANVPLKNIMPPYPCVLIDLPKPIAWDDKMVHSVMVCWRKAREKKFDCGEGACIIQEGSFLQPGVVPTAVARRFFGDDFKTLVVRGALILVPPAAARCILAFDFVATIILLDKDGDQIDFQEIKWLSEDAEILAQDFYALWMERTEKDGFRRDKWKDSPEYQAWQETFRLVCNVFCYLSSPGAVITRRSKWANAEKTDNRKKREEMLRELSCTMPPDTFLVGQELSVPSRPGEGNANGEPGSRQSPHTHWRRGHWHGYWVGKKNGERSMIYRHVEPVLVVGKGTPEPGSLIAVK